MDESLVEMRISMIVEPRIVSYINSLDKGNSEICDIIEQEALADDVPIIRKEMGNLLKVLLALTKPHSILEVGTAVGYSSILMSENMPENCHITTIENYDKRIPVARNNFKRAGKKSTPPNIARIGVIISLFSEVTIDVNAPPIITPTAISMALPRAMNCLNSAKNFFISIPIPQTLSRCLITYLPVPSLLPPWNPYVSEYHICHCRPYPGT